MWFQPAGESPMYTHYGAAFSRPAAAPPSCAVALSHKSLVFSSRRAITRTIMNRDNRGKCVRFCTPKRQNSIIKRIGYTATTIQVCTLSSPRCTHFCRTMYAKPPQKPLIVRKTDVHTFLPPYTLFMGLDMQVYTLLQNHK